MKQVVPLVLVALFAGIALGAPPNEQEFGFESQPFQTFDRTPPESFADAVVASRLGSSDSDISRMAPGDEEITLAAPPFRMPGEFERQEFLFLSCGELNLNYADTIAKIAGATRRHIGVVVLYSGGTQRKRITQALRRNFGSADQVTLVRLVHDTKWIRDFGPTTLQGPSQSLVVDWQYEAGRPNDDDVPLHLAQMSQTPLEAVPLVLEGGNLLSNGEGILLTTNATLDKNDSVELGKIDMQVGLKRLLGARELVILEPLAGEETGHVDMFVTFPSANTVVVGAYSEEEDAENAAILNRNAARLATVRTRQGFMNVIRIPMDANADGIWRTYTNCIYANGVMLVPSYEDGDADRHQIALATYRQLLPKWRVEAIDATELIREGGALHCISLNVPALSKPLQTKNRKLGVAAPKKQLLAFPGTKY